MANFIQVGFKMIEVEADCALYCIPKPNFIIIHRKSLVKGVTSLLTIMQRVAMGGYHELQHKPHLK